MLKEAMGDVRTFIKGANRLQQQQQQPVQQQQQPVQQPFGVFGGGAYAPNPLGGYPNPSFGGVLPPYPSPVTAFGFQPHAQQQPLIQLQQQLQWQQQQQQLAMFAQWQQQFVHHQSADAAGAEQFDHHEFLQLGHFWLRRQHRRRWWRWRREGFLINRHPTLDLIFL